MTENRQLLQTRQWTLALLAPEMASHGGVQSFMRRIWDCLQHMLPVPGKLLLAVVNDSAQSLKPQTAPGMPVHILAAERSKLKFVVGAARLAPMDAMIVGHLGQSPVALVLKLLGRVRRYVVILHGNEAWVRVSLLRRLACRHAYCVIATTKFTAGEFARHNGLPLTHIRVVPLCANETPPGHSRFRLRGDFRVLIVGRQFKSEGMKGFAQLIDALALMREAGRTATLHIVGEGDDQPALRDRARARGVAAHVVFHGALTDFDLAGAYASCDVYAMPSGQEGFGIAFLEAMKYAKPCVGALAGGIPEVVRDGVTGLLVPYGEVRPLAEALSRLYDDRELARNLGAAGLRDTQTTFSSKAFYETYQRLVVEMTASE